MGLKYVFVEPLLFWLDFLDFDLVDIYGLKVSPSTSFNFFSSYFF